MAPGKSGLGGSTVIPKANTAKTQFFLDNLTTKYSGGGSFNNPIDTANNGRLFRWWWRRRLRHRVHRRWRGN